MTEKFTPGPLRLVDKKLYDENDHYVAHIDTSQYVNLFNVASSLYSAILEICDHCDGYVECYELKEKESECPAYKALKKARGEE